VYKLAANQMAEKLQHRQELCNALIPKWELGCRRITPGEGYLESFLLPNVELTQSPIVEVTETGIRTADGKFHEVDVGKLSRCRTAYQPDIWTVVCATGFDVSYRPPYPIIGRNGVELGELWSKEPISYMSLACPHMPNYFLFTGPNATIGHGSLMESLGWTAAYIIKWMKKILEEDIKAIVPKEQAVADFVAYEDQIHKTLVWSGGCRSWYKNSTIDGRVVALFGGSALLYRHLISNLRPEDFEIEFRSANRYRFLGNGFTEYELEKTNDLAWYVEK
jgi:cation diffusion facilitator CzcD-associated flavoprotein CzcO